MEKHLEHVDGAQQAQLDDMEARAAELARRWITRALWTLEDSEPGELKGAATEAVEETTRVLELIERVHEEVHRLRVLSPS